LSSLCAQRSFTLLTEQCGAGYRGSGLKNPSAHRPQARLPSGREVHLEACAPRTKNAKTTVDTNQKRDSIPNMVRIFATVMFLSAASVFAQMNPTAYDALRVVGNQVNRDFVNRVVSVTGVDGSPQPATWRILIDDPNARGGIREVEVTDGHISSNRVSTRQVTGTPQGATINPARLNLDSSGAYEVASRT